MDNRTQPHPFDHTVKYRCNSAGKARCEPGWNWQPRPLADFDMWYVVSGSGRMRIADQSFEIHKGVCVLVRPGDQPVAEQDPDDRLTVIYIHFSVHDAQTGESFVPGQLPDRRTLVPDTFAFETMLDGALESNHAGKLWAAQEFDCRLKLLLMQLYRLQNESRETQAHSPKQRQLIGRVMSRIREEGGRRMALDELAAAVGLAPSYLSVLFKKVTGQPLKTYITQVRLERAMHLLTETAMNVSQVSDALEYANVTLFSKQFKEHFGQPPSHFHLKAMAARPHIGGGPKR